MATFAKFTSWTSTSCYERRRVVKRFHKFLLRLFINAARLHSYYDGTRRVKVFDAATRSAFCICDVCVGFHAVPQDGDDEVSSAAVRGHNRRHTRDDRRMLSNICDAQWHCTSMVVAGLRMDCGTVGAELHLRRHIHVHDKARH